MTLLRPSAATLALVISLSGAAANATIITHENGIEISNLSSYPSLIGVADVFQVTSDQTITRFAVQMAVTATTHVKFEIYNATTRAELYESPQPLVLGSAGTTLGYQWSETFAAPFTFHPGTIYAIAAVPDTPETFGYDGDLSLAVGGFVFDRKNEYVTSYSTPSLNGIPQCCNIHTEFDVAPVSLPEPGSIALLGGSLLALGVVSRRRTSRVQIKHQ